MKTFLIRNSIAPVVLAAWAGVLSLVHPPESAGQMVVPEDLAVEIEAVDVPMVAAIEPVQVGGVGAPASGSEPDGGALKTDPETHALFARANQFAEQGRYDLASVLWQKVLDESADIVFPDKDLVQRTLEHEYQRFRPAKRSVETTLAGLPPEGLRAYRIQVDGEVQSLLAADGRGREAALGEVVKRYFLSSRGDEAAYELACMKLDRFEFLPAARILGKILREYPTPTVSKAEVHLRLAVCAARVGDFSGAATALKGLEGDPDSGLPESVLRAVRDDIARLQKREQSEEGPAFASAPGSPANAGRMPRLPAAELPGSLKEAWSQEFALKLPEGWPKIAIDMPFEFWSTKLTPKNDPALIALWQSRGWVPAGRILVSGDRLLFKTVNRLVCCDLSTGMPVWLGFRNEFAQDAVTKAWSNYGGNTRFHNSKPFASDEVVLFGDRVNQSMVVSGNSLFTLQGKPMDVTEDYAAPKDKNTRNHPYGRQISRTRTNRLAAYNMRNGKLRWIRPAWEEGDPGAESVCFMGQPVPYGGLVLVPVSKSGSLWLLGLSADTGETHWKAYLADEPPNGCSLTSPVSVAVDGGEAYVATGAGLVFALDALSGGLNWALRYPRTSAQTQRRSYGPGGPFLIGWDEDTIIPVGRQLVILPSDFNYILVLDRKSGGLQWESAMRPLSDEPASAYCLGVSDEKLIVAGPKVARAYRLAGGRMLWETPLPGATGRGAFTGDAIYVPAGGKILRLDPETGKAAQESTVRRSKPTEPIGNLFSDGKRLLAFGLKRIYALEGEGN